MGNLMDLEMVGEVHKDLLREARQWRLAREARRAVISKPYRSRGRRVAESPAEGRGIEVRRGREEDKGRVARLLELNGAPRRLAFEGSFMVAEKDDRVVAALRYITAPPEGMFLGVLVADLRTGEREPAVALYRGARELARQLGVREVRARTVSGDAYLLEAGYRSAGGGCWKLDVSRPAGGRVERPVEGWRRVLALFGAASAVPFSTLSGASGQRAGR